MHALSHDNVLVERTIYSVVEGYVDTTTRMRREIALKLSEGLSVSPSSSSGAPSNPIFNFQGRQVTMYVNSGPGQDCAADTNGC